MRNTEKGAPRGPFSIVNDLSDVECAIVGRLPLRVQALFSQFCVPPKIDILTLFGGHFDTKIGQFYLKNGSIVLKNMIFGFPDLKNGGMGHLS